MDVYATRGRSKSPKGVGYYPVCSNRWNDCCPIRQGRESGAFCKTCDYRIRPRLTAEEIVRRNLSNHDELCLGAIGIYPLKDGNVTRFVAIDLDSASWQSDARIIRYYEDSQPYIYYPLRRQYISGWHTEVFVDYICQQNIKGINLREEATENNSPFAEICIGDELVAVMYTSAPGWVFNNIPSKFSECKSFDTTNFSQFTVTDNNSSFICLVNKDNTDGIRLDPEYIDEIIEELQSVLNNATN